MMNPERKKKVKGHEIHEYYWNGKMVVYVDSKSSELTFDQAVQEAEGKEKGNDG